MVCQPHTNPPEAADRPHRSAASGRAPAPSRYRLGRSRRPLPRAGGRATARAARARTDGASTAARRLAAADAPLRRAPLTQRGGRTRSASSQRRSSRPRRREPRRRGGSVRAAQPPSPCQRKFSGAARARTRARPSSGTAAAGMIICAQRDNESEPRVERAAHLRHGWVEDRGCAPAVSGLTSV